MSGTDDDILAREIEKLSILGRGARWAARLLRNNTAEFTLEVEVAPETVKEAVVGILLQEGNIILRGKSSTPIPSISAVVGSGTLNLNPALVRVRLESTARDTTKISICGTTKEGLIKQRAGEKAAKRICDLLEEALSATG